LDRRYDWNGKLSGDVDIMMKGFLDKAGEELRSEGRKEGRFIVKGGYCCDFNEGSSYN
jgi:hypothetical protein